MFNHFCVVWLQLFQNKLMVERREIVPYQSTVASSFNNFFEDAIPSLGIKTKEYCHESYGLKSLVEIAFKKFEQKILLTRILLTMKVLFFTNKTYKRISKIFELIKQK